ncbi:hypothetical protein H0G86_009183 [Trichoderma simmonsii]|uniref:Uncharacterized protein n=1 Tax=Trichoderma simmonsii TaxID=1491479 RepID=A0A8G0LHH1_9HYPO|nr:hypothetical protein H0G86_009183 [Trichoderma simmonsii]
MYTSILFPSTSIKVLDLNTVFNTPVGAYIRPSTTSPSTTSPSTTSPSTTSPSTTSPSITISATTNYHTKNLCSFSSITVPCAGMPSRITHVSVTFEDVQVLDTDVSEGFMDFTLYPDQDLESPDGVQEINIVLDVSIPSDSNGLVIKDISMKLFEDYN